MRVIISYEEAKRLEYLVTEGLQTDGGTHKQWFLEQIAELFELEIRGLERQNGVKP